MACPLDPTGADRWPVGRRRGLVEAVGRALTGYAWRRLTPRAVAAVVIAVADESRRPPRGGHRPEESVVTPGMTPAHRDDERVDGLVLVLDATPGWRDLTAEAVARRLVTGLGSVEERALWFDLEVRWLLEPPS
ncbi:hypothetical protein [Trujillonella humicola]|uniref:hypothetical protein n=1 Tax=Trujillonella humicola TaxID=3383699 RepID=UPI003906C695